MANAECAAGKGVQRGAVARAVVDHHPFDFDAVTAVERDRPAQKPDGRGRLLVGEDLGVSEAGGVVDADVDVVLADARAVVAAGPAAVRPVSAAGGDPAELLDVGVQQLARLATLVAVRWLRRIEPRGFPSPMRARTAGTVETAISRHMAISAPVIRNRRSAAMVATRSSGVRCGTDFGSDDRSMSPVGPSSR